MRRTSVQPPKGTWIGALELLNPIETIIKSPAEVPAGTGMVTFDLGGRKARMCALPASAFPAAVAVLVPVAPATACSTRFPSIETPLALVAPLGRSKDSLIPVGGVHVREEANACELTSIALGRLVVRAGAV